MSIEHILELFSRDSTRVTVHAYEDSFSIKAVDHSFDICLGPFSKEELKEIAERLDTFAYLFGAKVAK